jgi:hypothetical protein
MQSASTNSARTCATTPARVVERGARALTLRRDFLALERGSPVRVNGQDAWYDGFTHSPCAHDAIWVYAQRPLPDGSPGVLDGSPACPAWHQVDYTLASVELPA